MMGRIEGSILFTVGLLALTVNATRSAHRLANVTRPGALSSVARSLTADDAHAAHNDIAKLRGSNSKDGQLAAAVSAAVKAAAVKVAHESQHRLNPVSGKDPYLCLQARFNSEPCPANKCADEDGKCSANSARRTGLRFRISPISTSGAFLRAEIFPQYGSEEPALRLVDGWKWERDDANWVVVASPQGESVLLSTAASWPADQSRREGPVRVLDFAGASSTPRMMPLEAAGQAEWYLEEVESGRVRLRHHRTGRYLHMPGVTGFFQALLQLWSGEPHLDSSKVPNMNTLFIFTPPEALDELKNLGLVHSSEAQPMGAFSFHWDSAHLENLHKHFFAVLTDARQYMQVHKGLLVGGFFILFALTCFSWCCCLGSPAEEKASFHGAPAPTIRTQTHVHLHVRRAPRHHSIATPPGSSRGSSQ